MNDTTSEDLLARRATLARERLLEVVDALDKKRHHVVATGNAQDLQDELGRLWEAVQRHDSPGQAAAGLEKRLTQIVAETSRAEKVSFEDWVMLDRMARRLEAKLLGNKSLIDTLDLETARRAAKEVARTRKHLEDDFKQLKEHIA